MDIQHKAYKSNIDASDAGEITALVSVFGNTDFANEKVMPGAFTKSLQKKLPKGVVSHDWSKPCAKTLEAYETAEGLVIRGQFNLDTQIGREAFSNVKFYGVAEQEFSIGYQVIKDSIEEKTGVRELHEILLHEWSPVLVGMNDQTQLLNLKAGVPTTLAVEAEAALMSMLKLYERMKSLADLRRSQGREPVTATNKARIADCSEAIAKLQQVGLDLEALLVEPEAKADLGEVRQVYASYLLTVSANYRSQ